MSLKTDVKVVSAELYFLPVKTRMPLKFGAETLTEVTCARVCLTVEDSGGRRAKGWGETPLSVQWTWPGDLSYNQRHAALQDFCRDMTTRWTRFDASGHPLEIGHDFQEEVLPAALADFNAGREKSDHMPLLAALVCISPFDIALHDAYGNLHGKPVYETYGAEFLGRDLASFIEPAEGSKVSFKGLRPADFFQGAGGTTIPVWHLVGGADPISEEELTGKEPDDGYPVLLRDWIERDGLNCLKVKLRGNDAEWDYRRLVAVGRIAAEMKVDWLSTDFNCMVKDPDYVNRILDQLILDEPRIYGMILYVEQPFPYELEEHPIDVHSVASRKPLFLDESAHNWKMVRLGYELGWTGVALKTCKTQTGALLSACWARAHGMSLMVQDLTNPMLAQIPHVLLAAKLGTLMGVESNAMQFYPEASSAEAKVHPGLYQRRNGILDISTMGESGFGYRLEAIERPLPPVEQPSPLAEQPSPLNG